MNQLIQLTISHFKDMIREPAVLFWGIGFPILMSLGLGLAFTQKSDIVHKIAILQAPPILSDSSKKIQLLTDFIHQKMEKKVSKKGRIEYEITFKNEKLGNTTFLFIPSSWDSSIVMLKRGNIGLILEEKNNELNYHFDPLNAEAQLIHLQLVQIFGVNDSELYQHSENIKPLTLNGTRYIDFLIPGLLSMGIMSACMWGLSYDLIDKRSKKLLRRLVATPMSKGYFLFSLLIARFAMNTIETFIIFLFAYFYFSIHIQGSILGAILIFISGNFAFAGIAIFISSRTARNEIGTGLINSVTTPMMILSGIFFSYQNFPEWSQPVIKNLPLTMLADGFRNVFNEGASLAVVSSKIILLFTIGFVFFILGLKIFKWF
jgi:ABC-type multidrug transport system permease subunit